MAGTERRKLAHTVRLVLAAGLALSALMLFAGLALIFLHQEARPFGPPPGFSELAGGALQGRGVALVYLGLLILMATPLARVALLAAGWAVEGEWRFCMVALTVLLLLALSLTMGMG